MLVTKDFYRIDYNDLDAIDQLAGVNGRFLDRHDNPQEYAQAHAQLKRGLAAQLLFTGIMVDANGKPIVGISGNGALSDSFDIHIFGDED